MVSSAYLSSRKKWDRPQAIILSNNSNGIINGVPQIEGVEGEDFIILSDHNRSEISITPNRIENRKRMVNGHLRSYHIADKISLSVSWSLLPSRAYNGEVQFSENGSVSLTENNPENLVLTEYTADGGAGGEDLLRWYENNTGSFYMFLSYDKPSAFSSASAYAIENLSLYSDVIEVFFTSFDYKIVKRGKSNHDLWNISTSFEEV